eukprot:9739863-Karenia_brevis.AAC.1
MAVKNENDNEYAHLFDSQAPSGEGFSTAVSGSNSRKREIEAIIEQQHKMLRTMASTSSASSSETNPQTMVLMMCQSMMQMTQLLVSQQ